MSDVGKSASPGQSRQLIRALGPGMAMAMVVGNVIGAGIFMKPGEVARAAGNFPTIISAWITGGAICILGALCFAELAVMRPEAGGMYVYLREAYGRLVAFLFGWSEFMFGRPASNGALAAGIVFQAGQIAGVESVSAELEVAVSLGLIVLLAVVNVLGVIWGGRTQAGTTLIKAGFLGIVALVPFVLSLFGNSGIDPDNYRTSVTPGEFGFLQQFSFALLAIMWAYNGWHGVTPIAEEIRDPERNILLALFGGLAVLIVLYLGANLAYHGVLSMEEISAADTAVPQHMLRRVLAPFGDSTVVVAVTALSLVAICSMFGAINTNLMNGPRIAFAMGRDGVFFRSLGDVHARWRTPVVAIIAQAVMACAMIVTSAVLVRNSEIFADTSLFEVLTNCVIFTASVFYMLTVGAVIILRMKRPDWARPYRTPGYPWVPILYLILNLVFLACLTMEAKTRQEGILGLGLSALGIPVFYAWQHFCAGPRNTDRESG